MELERVQADARTLQRQNAHLRKRLENGRQRAERIRNDAPVLLARTREVVRKLKEEMLYLRIMVIELLERREWKEIHAEAVERTAEIDSRVKRVIVLERRVAEEKASNAAKSGRLARLQAKHMKALMLLGEYHCRIQALTGSRQYIEEAGLAK
jgi:hypothetical protein